LGQSNHFKLKTSEIMKVNNSLSPVLFIHHFQTSFPPFAHIGRQRIGGMMFKDKTVAID
jgi:hypothetical protein